MNAQNRPLNTPELTAGELNTRALHARALNAPARDMSALYTPLAGQALLEAPLLNKGSAFFQEERAAFNLEGLLPEAIETIDEQSARAYRQYSDFDSDIDRHIYLRNIQDTNETLFYYLLTQHLAEMMPVIYTPTVGLACEQFSRIYRRGRGLFVSYNAADRIEEILNNVSRVEVKIIVVTDGERILGLGDQGIGGMGIPIGKLSLYTACAGIDPAHTLPVVLDVGTNNPTLLNDPMYMGWRHPRIGGDEYTRFVDRFIEAARQRWPDVIFQFEDFAQQNATPLLARYRDQVCCFNDDIQGTAAVTAGTLLAACAVQKRLLSEQRVCIVGAGSAGCGIAEAIIAHMVAEGIDPVRARQQLYMVDRHGLLTSTTGKLMPFQQALAQPRATIGQWHSQENDPALQAVIDNVQPTVLIGVSGCQGLFGESVIRAMAEHCESPIIFPLSNPTNSAEALPEDVIRWTDGRAIVATGSPFAPVEYRGRHYPIAQCNNSYIFPGIGLGAIAANARSISDEMLMQCSRILAENSPLANGTGPDLLPPLGAIQMLSKEVALAVAKTAMCTGLALPCCEAQLIERIESIYWHPRYRRYKRNAL